MNIQLNKTRFEIKNPYPSWYKSADNYIQSVIEEAQNSALSEYMAIHSAIPGERNIASNHEAWAHVHRDIVWDPGIYRVTESIAWPLCFGINCLMSPGTHIMVQKSPRGAANTDEALILICDGILKIGMYADKHYCRSVDAVVSGGLFETRGAHAITRSGTPENLVLQDIHVKSFSAGSSKPSGRGFNLNSATYQNIDTDFGVLEHNPDRSWSTNSKIINCYAENFMYPVHGIGGQSFVLENCRFTNNKNGPLLINNQRAQILNNQIEKHHDPGCALTVQGVNITVSGNTVDGHDCFGMFSGNKIIIGGNTYRRTGSIDRGWFIKCVKTGLGGTPPENYHVLVGENYVYSNGASKSNAIVYNQHPITSRCENESNEPLEMVSS